MPEAKTEMKRFCVQYRESRMIDGKHKARCFIAFFDAVDPGGAETEFWDTPIWKPPVKKIEIVSIEEV